MTGLERVGGAAGRRLTLHGVVSVALGQRVNDSIHRGRSFVRLPVGTFQCLMANTSQARAVDVEAMKVCPADHDELRDMLMSARVAGARGDHQAQNERLDVEENGE